jgi:hypothetical protein
MTSFLVAPGLDVFLFMALEPNDDEGVLFPGDNEEEEVVFDEPIGSTSIILIKCSSPESVATVDHSKCGRSVDDNHRLLIAKDSKELNDLTTVSNVRISNESLF